MDLRVAHVIASLSIGGAERHLVNLLNALNCEFRSVVYLSRPTDSRSFHGELDAEVKQYFVGIRRRNLPLGILRLASAFKRMRVNVVHTHMFEASLYGALAARLAGVPVVVTTEHGENPWKNPFSRWLERNVTSRLVDIRYCVSPQILTLRRDVDGVPEAKLRLVINGTLLPPHKPRLSGNSVPVIGSVGRFIPAKDYARLLHAVSDLRDIGHAVRLCLVGDGPEAGPLRELATQLGLGNTVEFPGMVSDIGQWYEQFDIYVSSSSREGLPVALLEAMAHGLPVVATDVGASADAVGHGVGGLVVPPGDTKGIAIALGTLLHSADLRAKFGANARARVEKKYSIQSVAATHKRAYLELLALKQGLPFRQAS